ncbi:hypothetical protein PP175_21730 [Aneurinibacillus sp. Ricciae_BoGa-3]|uniref:hypothetical protein n=1 Tax=Aneurinibacillus sp. Ricciae_BoGa-3 TaxID=3022697 RepID=UPI00233FBEAE|nr:hypothetical protein [Aneurinibacillus sp. Ricciae_BoGa-3]WCK53912.1 hypothetical protein PP175_21730 [Aneurinibacillus sp. Ricciae_BoGa-3]
MPKPNNLTTLESKVYDMFFIQGLDLIDIAKHFGWKSGPTRAKNILGQICYKAFS